MLIDQLIERVTRLLNKAEIKKAFENHKTLITKLFMPSFE